MSISKNNLFSDEDISLVESYLANGKIFNFSEKWWIIASGDILDRRVYNYLKFNKKLDEDFPLTILDAEFEQLISFCKCLEDQ